MALSDPFLHNVSGVQTDRNSLGGVRLPPVNVHNLRSGTLALEKYQEIPELDPAPQAKGVQCTSGPESLTSAASWYIRVMCRTQNGECVEQDERRGSHLT